MPLSTLFANGNKPNIVLIITDQQRALRYWPASFIVEHLPSLAALQQNGLTFNQAFTAACMCSPSRATFLTSQYPAVTGVTTTGTPEPTPSLPTTLTNLAGVLSAAGYATASCVWNGKWHVGPMGVESLQDFGFSGWDPPDAGNSLSNFTSLGGGTADNDGRYLNDMLSFVSAAEAPFCLVASFVNPHDVYVAQTTGAIASPTGTAGLSGYPYSSTQSVSVPLPPNNNDSSLATAARVHGCNDEFQTQITTASPPATILTQQDYINFYAFLQTVADAQIGQLLAALGTAGFTENTLFIRFADHGEMGVSHNLVEKFYNVYEETLNVPLVFSNPVAWPQPATTNALASLVDLVPTLASLLGVSSSFTGKFVGQDLSPILEGTAPAVQDYVHFTYDDEAPSTIPGIIRAIRTATLTYAVYFVADGSDADWELFDPANDPSEDTNLAGNPAWAGIQAELDRLLQAAMAHAKTTPKGFTWPPKATSQSRGVPPQGGSARARIVV